MISSNRQLKLILRLIPNYWSALSEKTDPATLIVLATIIKKPRFYRSLEFPPSRRTSTGKAFSGIFALPILNFQCPQYQSHCDTNRGKQSQVQLSPTHVYSNWIDSFFSDCVQLNAAYTPRQFQLQRRKRVQSSYLSDNPETITGRAEKKLEWRAKTW